MSDKSKESKENKESIMQVAPDFLVDKSKLLG
jgi:hypothetical protein